MNEKYLSRLVEAMYKIEDCPVLDEYGSKIFGRPVRRTWRLFRHITKTAYPYNWNWSADKGRVSYPDQIEVPTIDEFATFMLHEVAHGWCYFHKDDLSSRDYPTGVDEEQVCWDVSKLVCEVLGVVYHEESANLCHRLHIIARECDSVEYDEITKKLPEHVRHQ